MKVLRLLPVFFLLSLVPALAQDGVSDQDGALVPDLSKAPVAVDLEALYAAIDKSPEGIRSYRDSVVKMQALVERTGKESIFSTVTFAKPLSWASAIELIDTFSLDLRLVYMHFEEADGRIGTATARLSAANREAVRAAISDMSLDNEFLGVVSLVGMVPARGVRDLQSDRRVFLVDPTADESFVVNPGHSKYMHHLAWDLRQSSGTTVE